MGGNNAHNGEEPRNPNVRHEPGDVNAKSLTRFGLSMVLLIIIFLFGLWGMFEYLKKRAAEAGAPLSPTAMVNAQKQPPEPRLQDHPARDMRVLRAEQERVAHQYALLDPDKGIVRIPIDRAMDLIAERGLPVPAASAEKKK